MYLAENKLVTSAPPRTFGTPLYNRGFSFTEGYKYGFNGQEKDNEIAGKGNTNTALHWEYDTRLGRRWNLDLIIKPWQSDYLCFSGNPIFKTDINGDDDIFDVNGHFLRSTKTGDNIKIQVSNTKTIYLSEAKFKLTTIKETDGSTREVGTKQSNSVIGNIVNHYSNSKANFTVEHDDGSYAASEPDKKTIHISTDKTGRTSPLLNNYHNFASAVLHEEIHRNNGDKGMPASDLSLKGASDHLDVYLKQMKDPSWSKTTPDYQKQMLNNVETLIGNINFQQNGKSSVDSDLSKQYRKEFDKLKSKDKK